MRAEPHRSLDAGKQTDSSWQEALSAPCESSGQRKLGGIAIPRAVVFRSGIWRGSRRRLFFQPFTDRVRILPEI
jgi:hypothetical protein